MGILVPGAMAQYVSVPAHSLYPLPDVLDWELGALVEPLAVALHGLHLAGLAVGERALVLGSGALGLMAILAAREVGADVVATYRYPHQGEAALAVGAQHTFAADGGGTRALAVESQRGPFDVVVETVGGQANTLEQALKLVNGGGRVLVLGVFTQAISLNTLALLLREVRILGSNSYCRSGPRADFDVALDLVAAAPERARRTITHRLPLMEAADAFAIAAAKDRGSLKVQVNPWPRD
jgi:2-desacetyl-2-hydroxyethyl bacteriochlorophyllide A dehydrogenase